MEVLLRKSTNVSDLAGRKKSWAKNQKRASFLFSLKNTVKYFFTFSKSSDQ